jgi:polysaccharide biosynthesis transport protein
MASQNPRVPDDASPAADTPVLRKIPSVLWKKLWLIVLCVALSGAATVVYLSRFVPIFEATATVKLDSEQAWLLDLPGLVQNDSRTREGVESRLKRGRGALLSAPLLASVVEANALTTDPRFQREREKVGTNVAQLVQRLGQLVTVEIPRDDTLLDITVASPSPELAAQLANSLADHLLQHDTRSKEETIRTVSDRLQEILRKMTDGLQPLEKRLQSDRDETLKLRAELTEASQRRDDSRRMWIDARAKRLVAEAEYNEVQRADTNLDALLKVASVASDPKVKSARAALAQGEIAINNLKERNKHQPERIKDQTEKELAGLRQSLAEAVAEAVQEIRISLEAANAKEEALQKDYDSKNAEVMVLTRQIQPTDSESAREFDMQRTIEERVMKRLKEVAVAGDLFSSPFKISQQAVAPLEPVKPDRLRVTLLGLLTGLVVGVGLGLALGLVDSSFKSVEEAERYLNLPVLGAVPRVPALESTKSQVVMADDEHFIAAEAFRSLRTSVSVLAKERELRSFVFTSATPEEGKTFCALNYAASLAQQGLRTLLVECDLRRPMAAVALAGLKADTPGVSDFLKLQPVTSGGPRGETLPRNEVGLSFTDLRRKQRGVGDLPATAAEAAASTHTSPARSTLAFDELLQRTEIENLAFISAGTPAPNPSELLARQGISKLVGEAIRRFDRVVIDAAPMLGISDSLLLVNHVQATCLVIRAHRTPRKAVVRAKELLVRAEAPLLGIILNDLSATRSDQYGDYYHYYGREAR